jgi:hypothetical protein
MGRLVSRFGYNALHQLSTNQKQVMGVTKKILLVVAFLLIILGGTYIYQRYQNNGTATIPENYAQDPEALAEMEARVLKFEGKKAPNLIFNLEGGEATFEKGYFPIINISDSEKYGADPKFTAEKRGEHRERLKLLIERYGSIVNEASEVHRVPKIVIYGIMQVEHKDSLSLAKAEVYSRPNSSYIGLMQASVKTANDTLKRGVTNKHLSKVQIDFFKKEVGKTIDSLTDADLRTPKLNIHSATAFLSVLISKYGLDDLHKVVFSYNRGEFKLSQDKHTGMGIQEMVSYYRTHNIEGSQYIVRTLGKNGSFDILYNDLGITD